MAREWSHGPVLTTQELVDWFNAEHPVGTDVTAFPGTTDGRAVQGKTRTPAWVLPSDEPVVSITGLAGGIALSHIVCVRHHTHAIEATR
jgi:hypothetical protein